MSSQKTQRNAPLIYLTFQSIFVCGALFFLPTNTLVILYCVIIISFYTQNIKTIRFVMQNGIPYELIANSKDFFIVQSIKAAGYGQSVTMFGGYVGLANGNAILGSVISTFGLFMFWEARKGLRYFLHLK